jgi:hypothetical protein
MIKNMWLTTPETELLACIALALAEILQSITADDAAGAVRAPPR